MAGFDPTSIGLSLGGGLLSLLGGGNRLNGQQQGLLDQQRRIAGQFEQYGNGVPGSSPGERAALAQQHAQLGEQQLQQQNQAYGALNRNQGVGNLADFLQGLASQRTAQNMSLDSSHLMNALAQRRQALLDAAGVSQGASGLASQQAPPNQLPALFGQLAQQLAYKKYGPQANQDGGGSGGHTTLADVGVSQGEFTTPPATTQGLPQIGVPPAPGNFSNDTNSIGNQFRQPLGLSMPSMMQGTPGYSLGGQIRGAFMQPAPQGNGVNLGGNLPAFAGGGNPMFGGPAQQWGMPTSPNGVRLGR